jgi:cyclopropane-fatty-acyl-phospholipid synthase
MQAAGGSRAAAPFRIVARERRTAARVLMLDPYSAALSFVRGDFDVDGSLIAAVREWPGRAKPGVRNWLLTQMARFGPWRLLPRLLGRIGEARRLQRHYDRSNEFYRVFLDPLMVYSCAYFQEEGWGLDRAQAAKLDYICRKLDIQRGEKFLDIGCGWGALVRCASRWHGAVATGCTLSHAQAGYAREAAPGTRILECDYRGLEGQYDKIASVGMFEHVGRRRLGAYFRKISALLSPAGLFLNHGIVRPEPVRDTPETLFLQRMVFPGGELVHLSDVMAQAELAGLEVLDVENLRPHYALTCRAWVERLETNRAECLRHVDEATWRTWRLYLAASAVYFEAGSLEVHQVLLGKRESPHRRLTREYMYRIP